MNLHDNREDFAAYLVATTDFMKQTMRLKMP